MLGQIILLCLLAIFVLRLKMCCIYERNATKKNQLNQYKKNVKQIQLFFFLLKNFENSKQLKIINKYFL